VNSGPTQSTVVVEPLAPPGGISKSHVIPKGLTVVKPSAHVAAIAAARRQHKSGGGGSLGIKNNTVPRPGGGPIRRLGTDAAKRVAMPSTKPYYPSSDPSRLGSKAPSST
jgi:hypothetical protein